MILQFGAIAGAIGTGLLEVGKQLLPVGVDVAKNYLVRELTRDARREAKDRAKALAIQAGNSPGVSVATLGAMRQPVGGRPQRSTFVPAVQAPAQSGAGNVPLPTIPISSIPAGGFGAPAGGMIIPGPEPSLPGFGGIQLSPQSQRQINQMLRGGRGMPTTNGLAMRAGALGEPKYARDFDGSVAKFVCGLAGEGFISVRAFRQLYGRPRKPFYRFNRLTSRFELIPRRRMNPLNIRATERAGRRVMRTIDTVKGLLQIEKQMTRGRVRLRRKPVRRRRRTTRRRKTC